MPTRRTLLILSAAAAFFLLAAVNRAAVYIGLAADVAIVFLLLIDLSSLPGSNEVEMLRRHQRVLSLAEPNSVGLTLVNRSGRPLSGILQDNPPHQFRRSPEQLYVDVPARSRAELDYVLVPLERGRFCFADAVLRARGPLGLVLRDYRLSGLAGSMGGQQDSSFVVYPSVRSTVPRRMAALSRDMETGYHRLQRQIEGTSPSQIRQWAPGDSYRDINWKATARYDRPMVTQYDTDRNQAIYVFVDCGRLMRTPLGPLRKLDYAVCACADLARVATERGDHVGLCCFSDRVKVWHDAKGKRQHLLMILDSLATLRADGSATDYNGAVSAFLARARRRSLCLFLTALTESESAWELMRRLRSLRPRHVPAVVSLSDPVLEEAMRHEPRNYEEACRKLAVADLREEVELFGEKLRQSQGYFLEAPADALSLAAVQTYLDAKSRGLL